MGTCTLNNIYRVKWWEGLLVIWNTAPVNMSEAFSESGEGTSCFVNKLSISDSLFKYNTLQLPATICSEYGR